MQQTARMKDERIQQVENAVNAMEQRLQTVTKVLELNPPLTDVQAALRRKRPG